VTSIAKRILDEALALPEHEREELTSALSDSLSTDSVALSAEWTAELNARLEALERGDVELVAWEDVEARLRARIGG